MPVDDDLRERVDDVATELIEIGRADMRGVAAAGDPRTDLHTQQPDTIPAEVLRRIVTLTRDMSAAGVNVSTLDEFLKNPRARLAAEAGRALKLLLQKL